MTLAWDAIDRFWIDDETGLKVSALTVIAARDELADGYAARFRDLALLLVTDAMSVPQWRAAFEELLIAAIGHGYVFGRGGIEQMQPADWDRVAGQIAEQAEYVDAFAKDVDVRVVAAGTAALPEEALTAEEPYIGSRAALYAGTVVNSFEVAQVAAVSESRGDLVMPVYPADGRTVCKSNCRCSWEITGDDEKQQWIARWITEGDENVCAGCQERGRLYAELVIPYGSGGTSA